MKRGIILNLIILFILLLLAFLPWLLMLGIDAQSTANNCDLGGGSPPPGYCGELYSYGFGLGLLGSVTTPIILGITAIYIIVTVLLYLFNVYTSRKAGKPISAILTGMVRSTGIVVVVTLVGTLGVFLVNWYQVSFISTCNGLPSQPVQSNRSNGLLAMGVKLPEPQGTLQQYAILTVSPDGKESSILIRQPGSRDPAWSPDGNSLAFISRPDSKDIWDLNLMDKNGGDPTMILQSDIEMASPTWLPDGKTLLIQRWLQSSANPDHEIFSVNLNDKLPTRIPGGETFDGDMRISPDGKQVVFVSNRNNTDDIYVMNLDGSNVRQLTFNSSREIDPDWSPDGKWIVFSSSRGSSSTTNNYNLFIMAPDGTNQCQLTDNAGSEWQPVWSPDGQWIAYISLLDSKAYMIHPDGTDIAPIEISTPIVDLLSIDWQAQ